MYTHRCRGLRTALTLLAAAGLAGCTLEPGGWFAALTPSLTARYLLRADRAVAPGWQKLSNDYEVSVTTAFLELGDIRLLAAGEGGGSTSFDPARPPPGYTLCHGGHCHSTDGRLVPYAEIEAALAGGGGGGLQPVVTLSVGTALDLLTPAERPLACDPSCNLDRTRILRTIAPVTALVLEGTVRDGRQPPRLPATPFSWRLAGPADAGAVTPAPTMEAELDLPVDRTHRPRITLSLQLELAASVFDGVEFAALTAIGGRLDLASDPLQQARALENLAGGPYLRAAVIRRKP
jgi:hypothetical protein